MRSFSTTSWFSVFCLLAFANIANAFCIVPDYSICYSVPYGGRCYYGVTTEAEDAIEVIQEFAQGETFNPQEPLVVSLETLLGGIAMPSEVFPEAGDEYFICSQDGFITIGAFVSEGLVVHPGANYLPPPVLARVLLQSLPSTCLSLVRPPVVPTYPKCGGNSSPFSCGSVGDFPGLSLFFLFSIVGFVRLGRRWPRSK